MITEKVRHLIDEIRIECLHVGDTQVLEIQIDHRICIFVFIAFLAIRDLQTVEPRVVLRILVIEECIQHAEVQGLAETSGSGVEIHLGFLRQYLGDQVGFVDIDVSFITNLLEILDANRQGSDHDVLKIELRVNTLVVCSYSYVTVVLTRILYNGFIPLY